MNKLELIRLRAKAQMGDGEALFQIAFRYFWGIDCEKDLPKAY